MILKELKINKNIDKNFFNFFIKESSFSKWFDGSKIHRKNNNKVPLICYHSTNVDYNLDDIRPLTHFGTIVAANNIIDLKNIINGSRIYPVFLNIKNPLIIKYDIFSNSTGFEDDVNYLIEYLSEIFKLNVLNTGCINDNINWIINTLKNLDKDGIRYLNKIEDVGSHSYIITRSNQVKSIFDAFRETEKEFYKTK